jgi:tetratricopeptide repeat protein 8
MVYAVQARLGKAYYQLGLYRDAEKQFKSALKSQEMVSVHLELTKATHAPHTYGLA